MHDDVDQPSRYHARKAANGDWKFGSLSGGQLWGARPRELNNLLPSLDSYCVADPAAVETPLWLENARNTDQRPPKHSEFPS